MLKVCITNKKKQFSWDIYLLGEMSIILLTNIFVTSKRTIFIW